MQSEQSLLITKGETQWVFIFTPKEPFDAGRAITSTTPLSGTLVLEAELENSSLPKRKGTLEVRSPLDFSPGRIEVQQGIADRDKTVSIEFSPGVTRSFDPLPLIADHATIIRVFPEYTNPNSIPFSSVASLDGFSAEVRIDRDGSPVATMALDRCPNGEPYVFKDAYQNAEQTSLRNALGDVIPANLLTAAGQYTFSVILKNTTAVRERIADLANNTKDVDETFVRTKPISLLLTTGYASGESAPAADVRDWQEIKTLMPVEAGRVSFTDPARSLQQFSSTRSDMSFGSLSRMLTLWNQNNPSDQRQYHIMFATMPVVDGICRTPGAGGCAMSVNATIAVIQWQNQRGAVHELGHLLGLSDTYTTPMYPTYSSEPNPRRVGATDGGNRIQDGNINLLLQPLRASGDGNVMRDLMGAGPWIDRVEWDYLYRQRFRLGGPRVAPEQPWSGRYIVIAGIVSKNDVVHFDPFTVMETVPIVTDSSAGNYAVIFEDGGGRKLQRREVPIFFHVPGGGDRDTVQFAWTFPLPESTARITLARSDGARDVELARRIFSAGTPTVRVLAPKNGPQLAGDVIVRWSAADPDGDPMTYDILYSPDGVEQMVAAVLVRDTQCVINTRTLRTSASAHFTVIANDGVNEGRARSETVSVTHVDQRDDPFTPAGTRPSIETLYPNPAADRVIIRCTLPQAGHTRVTLTDLLGRIVAVVADQEKSAGVFELNVPLFDLPAGLYLVTLEANGKRITKTLLHRER